MKKLYAFIVDHKAAVLAVFAVLFVICLFLQKLVSVNYDINDYLPPDVHSTVSLDVMTGEFTGGIPNARVMVKDVMIPEALEYKEKFKNIEGVLSVSWLDDAADIRAPLSTIDKDVLETYYKDGAAVFTLSIDEEYYISATDGIREIIGDGNAMSGSAVSIALTMAGTVAEIAKIAVVAVIFVLIVLLLTTNAWLEPLLVLGGLGVAIVINGGTNLIFGEISFVTNAAGSILQLGVSLDYSVFLIHRFEECRKTRDNARDAMIDALCLSTSSILSSGLTTVIGFLALVLMRFGIGPDLGLALAKGVAISLLTVFFFMPPLLLVTYRLTDKTRHKKLVPSFERFGKFVRRASIPMVCVFAVVIVPAYLASNANEYYYGSLHIFGDDTQFGRDNAAIEDTFGKSDTFVLLVPSGDTPKEAALSRELRSMPQIKSIISYVDTVGAEIPPEYLDPDTLAQLNSGKYSRMVLTASVPVEGDETFALVESVRETAEKYYPGAYYLAGQAISTYDMMDTVTSDMFKVNTVAIAAVFIILLLTLRSVTVPVILVLSIETAIWLNLSIPYFMGDSIFYIAYLIISSIQLGSTVDYAILMTDRYRENRLSLGKRESVVKTVSDVTVSIITSGSVLTVVGLLLGFISSNQLLSQLGIFIGRGAILSLFIVLFVLPGLLYLFDRLTVKREKKYGEGDGKGGKKEMKKNSINKAISFVLAAVMCGASLVPALNVRAAEETPSAASKEEVVYVNLNDDGTVNEINVVNIFELYEDGRITDHGDYLSLRNMTTTDKIDYKDGTVTVDAKAGRLYYEGRLSKNDIPWNIAIRYYIDGKPVSSKELAGKSGALRITIDISENKSYKGGFFDAFALQAQLSLDTARCRNIKADGATLANVGGKKQLSFTVLPGSGASLEITSDVTDFEYDGISINGIPLDLNIDIDDAALTARVGELTEAVGKLDDGAKTLADGVGELEGGVKGTLTSGADELTNGIGKLKSGVDVLLSGSKDLSAGALTLKNGASELDSGVRSLSSGIGQIGDALNTLDAQSSALNGGSAQFRAALGELKSALSGVSMSTDSLALLLSASSEIKCGIDSVASGATALSAAANYDAYKKTMADNGLDLDLLKDSHASAITGLDEASELIARYIAMMKAFNMDTTELEKQAERLVEVKTLLGVDIMYMDGTEEYLNSLGEGAKTLADGAAKLSESYALFDSQLASLVNILSSLAYRMAELSSAVNTLVSEYEKLDSGISAYTDGVAAIVKGYAAVSGGASELVQASAALKNGAGAVYDGAEKLRGGITEVSSGVDALDAGAGTLRRGAAVLADSFSAVYLGMNELSGGLSSLRKETDGLDSKISGQIDELVGSFTGEGGQVGSFVSDENENVGAVQFVIKTGAVKAEPPAAPVSEPEVELTFWQRLLKLFGLYK